MIYDTSIDHIIINELKSCKKHKGYLVKVINNIRKGEGKKPTTPKTVEIHLNRLKEEGIIGRDPPQLAGCRRYCWRLNVKEVETKLGLELVPTRRNVKPSIKDTKKKKIMRAVILVLSIAATCSVRFKSVSKAEPGDFEVINRVTGKPETVSLYTLLGVSAEDAADHQINDYSKKFSYTEFSEQEIRDLIKTLEEAGIMIESYQMEGKVFYEIADEQLRNFILDCYMLLQSVVQKMEMTWAYLREPHARSREQLRWYYSVVGEEQAKRFFLHDREKRKDNKLQEINGFLEQHFENKEVVKKEELFKVTVKDGIRGLDNLILSQIDNIEKWKWSITNNEKYGLIFSIIEKVVYPTFLKKLLDRNKLKT